MTTCPCGIAAVDCTYHAPAPESDPCLVPTKWHEDYLKALARRIVIGPDGEIAVYYEP